MERTTEPHDYLAAFALNGWPITVYSSGSVWCNAMIDKGSRSLVRAVLDALDEQETTDE